MHPFTYTRAANADEAIATADKSASPSFIAGGTTLLDLMKLNVSAPESLIDVSRLPLNGIEKRGDSVFIGALATNSDVAFHPLISQSYPVLSEAILSGASAQLRNMATVGGNIMQRTRCSYFRDPSFACNKRVPGSGCSAIDGFNRSHAILGGSSHCVATHGSDMCVALAALDAVIHTQGTKGARKIQFTDFHLLPSDHPELETILEPGELIVEIELPDSAFAKRSRYLKVRDRASYAFALSSVAVALELIGNRIGTARLALGGVATKPWRAYEAEELMTGNAMSTKLFEQAARTALAGAKPLKYNAFKIELTRRTIVRALKTAGGLS